MPKHDCVSEERQWSPQSALCSGGRPSYGRLAGLRFCFAMLLMLALTGTVAFAQSYPSRPITIVVPFGPGSGTDTVARIIGQHLSTALGQSVVIENKAGANGAIAATYVARAEPDGHTLFLSTNTPHAAAPTLNKTIAYDPVKDFSPISRVGSYTFVLAVHPSIPVNSITELVAYAKANPEKLSYASGNSTGIVMGETFKNITGIQVLHVAYRSAPPALSDVLGGRISMMFIDLAPGLPHIQTGAIKALAVTTAKRSPLLPDLPSMQEAGVAGLEIDPWAALFAPAKTPREIVMRLNAELRKIVAKKEVIDVLAAGGFVAFSTTPEELDDFVKDQLVKWTKLIKDAGIARKEDP